MHLMDTGYEDHRYMVVPQNLFTLISSSIYSSAAIILITFPTSDQALR
jgi:hypothetical protein